ncbi:MAG TPA: indolepyruvate oxidoreductase subunit beta [Smithellaceae bacterium]|jgi:indolepyruvate ferredoxin oxidoreductase beta subunit|nr:indolepyruvate oxidoreductase subunit beta [Syntrophaceae bacterium]HPV49824.1 indolepyruvate oxidoreductase subunit beta [Smithellaceae bacterium]
MNEENVKSILLAGVGGQGILRASDIMCHALMEAGYDVKKSEVHGMAQRGGCVTSHVRYGRKVFSPLAEPGKIELLLAFEQMEALRYLRLLSPDASIILNTEQINPPAVNMGDMHYPDDITDFLKSNYPHVVSFDASGLAIEAGSVKAANVVILGAAANIIGIEKSVWEKTIEKSFPPKLIKLNLDAFQKGITA